jgi:hypothetical protein
MTDSFVQVAADGSGKKLDTTQRVVGSNTVERQRFVLGGNNTDNFVDPTDEGNLPTTDRDMGVVVMLLERIANRMDIDPATGRGRVLIEAIAGSLTLTTVSTVSNLGAVGGVAGNGMVFDAMLNSWANQFLPCVTS